MKLQTDVPQSIDEIARLGAKALQEEVNEYLLATADNKDDNSHRLVVRNGSGKERTILTGTGEIKIKSPRLNDRRPTRPFTSL